MKTVNYSELRQDLRVNLDDISNNDELLVVHRSGGKSVVMMSMNEYNSIMETIHLIKSKNNRERLERSISDIESRKNLVKVNLIEDYDIPIIHIVSNGIEFKPKYNMDTSSIREGFVVDIIGEVLGCFGLENRYLVVEDCWVKIIEGDAGSTFDLEEIY